MTKEEVQKREILRAVTGSHAYGLNSPTSDVDEKAIIIEPIDEVAGLGEPWGGKVYSQAGHEDFEVYGLRKFLRLALKGNPTVTELLFVKERSMKNQIGLQLQEMYPLIVSRQAGRAYLGYMEAQRKRLTGERGNAGHGNPRQELIDKFGFDTKFAMHMLRLGFQGVELLTTGKLSLPISEPDRTYLRGVREGLFDLNSCLSRTKELEVQLRDLLDTSPIQEQPKTAEVEKWMLDVYFRRWSEEAAQAVVSPIGSGGGGVNTSERSVLGVVGILGCQGSGAVTD